MGGSEQHERLRRRRSPVLAPLIVAVIGLSGWIGWTALASEPAGTEADEPQSSIELMPLRALERNTGGPALRIEADDGTELAVLTPEGTPPEFQVRRLGSGDWTVLFSNGEVSGRLAKCPDEARCSGPVHLEVVDANGELVDGYEVIVLQTSEIRRVANGALVPETRGPFRFEAQGITVVLGFLEDSTRVRAFDEQSLELLWEHESRVTDAVPVAQRKQSRAGLVFETESPAGGLLSFLDLSGRIVWNQPRRGLVLSEDVGEPPSTLVISDSSSPTTLTGLSFESGEALWSYPTPEGFTGVEAKYLGNDRISVTVNAASPENEDFSADLDARTGEELWRMKLWRAGEVREFDGIFFWSGLGRLARIDPVTGDLLWEVHRGGFDSLMIDGDTVDLGDAGSFDLETGQRKRAPGRSPAG